MSTLTIEAVTIVILILFGLLFLSVPLAWSLIISGMIGLFFIFGWDKTFGILRYAIWSTTTTESLVCIPLFVLMGGIAFSSGLTEKLVQFGNNLLWWMRGGLAVGVICASAIFGAVSGSAFACISALGPIAIPEMSKAGYDKTFAGTVVALTGVIDSLIPPSLLMIMYGYMTDTSIAKLFMAGIIPGLITVVVYALTIYILILRKPSLATSAGIKPDFNEALRNFLSNVPMITIAIIVLGGIYFGWFTTTESAAIGCFLVLIVALFLKKLKLKQFIKSILDSGQIVAMMIFILIGANVLSIFISTTGIAQLAGNVLQNMGLSNFLLIAILFVIYLIMGCFLSGFALLALTVPIFYPIATSVGINPLWFAVFFNIVIGMGALTPPVGINIFLVEATAKDSELRSSNMFRMVIPFIISDAIIVIILLAFPQLCLWLPSTMR